MSKVKEKIQDKELLEPTPEQLDPYFRYLEKYVGTYRVLSHYWEEDGDFPRNEDGEIEPSFDELYIKTTRGEVRMSYRNVPKKDVILCVYVDSIKKGKNIAEDIKKEYPDIWIEEDEVGSFDYYIYFEEKDIKKIMKILKPNLSGAKIKPFSDKNLPAPTYTIPEKDSAKFDAIIKDLDKTEKMIFVRNCCKEFDAVMIKKFSKRGKTYDIEKERKETRLKPKVFISYKGMFDEFIEFTQNKYNKEFK